MDAWHKQFRVVSAEAPLIERAIAHWGVRHQVAKTIEELNELSVELARWLQLDQQGARRITSLQVLEEMADVWIMLQQMRLVFGPIAFEDARIKKLKRLRKRLEDGE